MASNSGALHEPDAEGRSTATGRSCRSWRSSRRSTGTTSGSTRPTDPELAEVLGHNRDEEKEHAAMTLEWLRRQRSGPRPPPPHLPVHRGDITRHGRGGTAERTDADGPTSPEPEGRDLGIGSLRHDPEETREPPAAAQAPITEAAWTEIEQEATRSLKHFLAAREARRLLRTPRLDVSGIDLGRVTGLASGPAEGVEVAQRQVLPMVELRTPFSLDRRELAAADGGARPRPRRRHRGGSDGGAGRGPHVFGGYQPPASTGWPRPAPRSRRHQR